MIYSIVVSLVIFAIMGCFVSVLRDNAKLRADLDIRDQEIFQIRYEYKKALAIIQQIKSNSEIPK